MSASKIWLEDGMPNHFAALDLGTNSCRLLIASLEETGFKVIYAFSRMIGLGDGLEEKRLLDDSIHKALEALMFCREKMTQHKVSFYSAVATAACRAAKNRDAFMKKIQEETGIKVDIIDAHLEAQLSFRGCSGLLDSAFKHALVFDIGGGSTEVTWADCTAPSKPLMVDCVSVPMGVSYRGITQETASSKLMPMRKIFEDFSLRNNIGAALREKNVQMISTSGTVTTLAAIDMNLDKYDRRHVDGISIPTTRLLSLINRLNQMTREERIAHPCIGESRADLIISGAEILKCIHQFWPVENMVIADRGVREGLLIQMADE